MNAPMLDRARAFDLLAPHLSDAKRVEVAAALADRIVTDLPPITRNSHGPAAVLDIPDDSPSREVAEFLAGHDVTGAALVRETVRLNAFLAEHPNNNRQELMRYFVARLKDETKEGAA